MIPVPCGRVGVGIGDALYMHILRISIREGPRSVGRLPLSRRIGSMYMWTAPGSGIRGLHPARRQAGEDASSRAFNSAFTIFQHPSNIQHLRSCVPRRRDYV